MKRHFKDIHTFSILFLKGSYETSSKIFEIAVRLNKSIKKMPKIDTLDALEEHEEHEDDYQTNSN